MSYTLLAVIVLAASLTAALILLLRGIAAKPQANLDPQTAARLLAGNYRPMERLLDPQDQAFLGSHPAVSPRMLRRFRAHRRKIFRAYLRSMARDFDKLSAALRYIMAASGEDRPELAALVLKQQVVFRAAFLAVECRLALHALGIGTVDIRKLVAVVDSMRVELRQLMPAPSAALA